MKKTLAMLLAALMLLSGLAGCASAPAAAGTPEAAPAAGTTEAAGSAEAALAAASARTEATVALSEDLITLDTMNLTTAPGIAYANMVYSGLVYDEKDGTFSPDLATEYSHNEDGTEWYFKLREGVTFHDGTPFTSADVVATFKRMFDNIGVLQTPTQTWANLLGCEANGDYECTLKMSAGMPESLFLMYLSSAYILPHALIEEKGDAFFTEMLCVGTGPWKFDKWEQGQYVSFVRNDDYWDKANISSLEKVYIRFITEESTRISGLQTGDIDVLYNVSTDQVPLLEGIPDVNLIKTLSNSIEYFQLAMDRGPFADDINLRKAFTHSINRQGICDAILGGGEPVTSTCVGSMIGVDPTLEIPAFDLELAKKYMADSHYDGSEIVFIVPNYVSQGQEIMLQIVSDMTEVGFNVKFEWLETAAFSDRRAAKDYTIFSTYYMVSDPDNVYKFRILTDGHKSGYVNEAMFKLIEEQSVEMDNEKRIEEIKEINRMIYDDVAPHVYGWRTSMNNVVRAGLTGVRFSEDGLYAFRRITAA